MYYTLYCTIMNKKQRDWFKKQIPQCGGILFQFIHFLFTSRWIILLYWRARRWTRCYFDKKPCWYRSNILSSIHAGYRSRSTRTVRRLRTREMPRRRVFFRRYLSSSVDLGTWNRSGSHLRPGCDSCFYGNPRHSFHFADKRLAPTIDNPRWLCAQIVTASLLRSRKSVTVSTFSALLFKAFTDEIVEGLSTRLSEFIDSRWPQWYEALLSAISIATIFLRYITRNNIYEQFQAE